jgi:hypothetical protein
LRKTAQTRAVSQCRTSFSPPHPHSGAGVIQCSSARTTIVAKLMIEIDGGMLSPSCSDVLLQKAATTPELHPARSKHLTGGQLQLLPELLTQFPTGLPTWPPAPDAQRSSGPINRYNGPYLHSFPPMAPWSWHDGPNGSWVSNCVH